MKIIFLILSFIITFCSFAPSAARQRPWKVQLSGKVFDSFTKVGIKATVVLMNADSVPLDTVKTRVVRDNSSFAFRVPAVPAIYLLKASAEGYKVSMLHYVLKHTARKLQFNLPFIYLQKDFDSDVYKSVDLKGVTVEGTRVRFTYRGDTLVYKASAFKIPSGSMLDALVQRLPGAELKSNGDIYVNGRKIDYLTLNGRDFFKGNNRIMLDNLPYYTIDELKVYERQSERSEWMGFNTERKDYVMDVSLKREYVTGYLGNTTVGTGTKDRYLGRLFAMRTTNHSQLSIYGNMNNINEIRSPGYSGDWEPSDVQEGVITTRQTGAYLNINDKDRRWKEIFSANVQWKKTNDQTQETNTAYSSSGNILSSSNESDVSRVSELNISNRFRLMKPFKLFANTQIVYSADKGELNSFSLTSLNQQERVSMQKSHKLKLATTIDYMQEMPTGDDLSLTFSGSYNRNNPVETRGNYAINYLSIDSCELRDTYLDKANNSYDYKLSANYIIHFLNHLNLSGVLNYQQIYGEANSLYYLATVFDPYNSNKYTNMAHKYCTALNLAYYNGWEGNSTQINLNIPLEYSCERLNYHGEQLDTVARRNNWNLMPSFYIAINRKGFYVNADYSLSIVQPEFATMMPVLNDFDPLYTFNNNAQLKNTISHKANAMIQLTNPSISRIMSVALHFNLKQNVVGRRVTYSTTTGHYTYKPDNVNGNWNIGTLLNYHRDWGAKKNISSDLKAGLDYLHSVDFDIAYDTPNNSLSKVNTVLSDNTANINYRHDNLILGLSSHLLWRNSSSHGSGFTTINVFEYDYGLNLQYTVPLIQLNISTDLKMFSRRGYSQSVMNTNDLVWNGTLSRSILKDKLTLKLTGYDILHQLSSSQLIIDSQGRTETIHNTIPSYVMLQLQYMFNIGLHKP